jgi:WD40 repeat protein
VLILRGHRAKSAVWAVAFSPDGRFLASCGNDDLVQLWVVSGEATPLVEWRRPYPICVAFAHDGADLACGHVRGVTLFHLDDHEAHDLRPSRSGRQIRFSPDGRNLAMTGEGYPVWDRRAPSEYPIDQTQRTSITGVAWSPDGGLLALAEHITHHGGNWEHFIRLVDRVGRQEIRRLVGHGAITTCLAFSPNGRLLAAACGQFLFVWSVASTQLVTRLAIDRLHFQSVAFTPDGRFLGAARNDNTVRFWDTATWRQHAAFDWDIGPLVSLDIARDGLRAAAGSKRGKIVVWDIDF